MSEKKVRQTPKRARLLRNPSLKTPAKPANETDVCALLLRWESTDMFLVVGCIAQKKSVSETRIDARIETGTDLAKLVDRIDTSEKTA